MDRRRLPDGWAAWFLIAATALPVAAVIRISWLTLNGSMDVWSTPSASGQALLGQGLLGSRWELLWVLSFTASLLLSGLIPLLVLAALVLAGRPRALVPQGLAREAATLTAAITATLGVAGVVGFLAQAAGQLPPTDTYTGIQSQVDVFAPGAAAVLITAVLGVSATAVLWPWHRRSHQQAEQPTVPDPLAEELATEQDGDEATMKTVSDRVAGAEPSASAPTPPQLQPQPFTPPALPTPSTADLDLYRRLPRATDPDSYRRPVTSDQESCRSERVQEVQHITDSP